MNSTLGLILSIISSSLGFVLSYFFLKNRSSKSYEPDYINAQIELQNKNYEMALMYFKDVLSNIKKDNPFFVSSLVGISEVYMELKDYKNASIYIKKAIAAAEAKHHNVLQRQLHKLESRIISNAEQQAHFA